MRLLTLAEAEAVDPDNAARTWCAVVLHPYALGRGMNRKLVLCAATLLATGASLVLPFAAASTALAQTAAASSGACPYWADAATGAQVPTTTIPAGLSVNEYRNYSIGNDQNHTHLGGQNLVLIPCPPPQTAASTGLYLGGELVKNSGWVRSTERFATTDVVTNQFSDRADPIGGGFLIGYKFAPWANSIVVSPFASFDFVNAPVNHTFAGGSYLGTTANFMGTFGVKAGPQLGMFWLYGIAGVSVLNETLNVNFIPVASSKSATVAGGTIGVGAAIQPSFLQGFGLPVSVFAEYQHTWWQDANFNTPAASLFFNYNFRRQDDVVKLGFTVSLGAPPSAPAPSYPVKAPMLK
jgi:hypothetical protein